MIRNAAVIAAEPLGLEAWEGYCLELVNEVLKSHPEGEILWVEPDTGSWTFHAVIVLEGIVHDAWHPEVMLPPEEYVTEVFGEGTPWEMNPGSNEDDDA